MTNCISLPFSVVGSATSHGADCKDVIISSQGFESYADPNEKPVEVSVGRGPPNTHAHAHAHAHAHTISFGILVQVVLAKVNQDSAAYVWPLNEVRAGWNNVLHTQFLQLAYAPHHSACDYQASRRSTL